MEIAQAFDFITELNDKYLKNNICQIGQYCLDLVQYEFIREYTVIFTIEYRPDAP